MLRKRGIEMFNFGKVNVMIQQFSAQIFLTLIVMTGVLYFQELCSVWESGAIYIAETVKLLQH